MPVRTSQEKFIYELSATLDAEQQTLRGLEQMQQQASDQQLRTMLEQHVAATQQQVEQLQQVMGMLDGQGQQSQQSCEAARGLVADAQRALQEAEIPELRDCFIGAAVLKNEHLEMATYRGLVMGAQQMGQQEVQQILQQNLQQEEQTAQALEQSMPQLLQKSMQAEGVAATAG